MEIPEQTAPNEPNFKLIVILSLVVLIAMLIGGYFFLHRESGHLPDGRKAVTPAGLTAG